MVTKNGESPAITSKVETVAPGVAAKWLETMNQNRKLTDSVVEKYAEVMRQGFWLMDGAPIRFNEAGELIDGQHRLWAVIESGTTQKFLVVRGLAADAFLVMDSGKKRGFSDVLTIEFPEIKNVLQVAAATRAIYRFELGTTLASLVGNRGSDIPNQVLLDFFQKNEDSIVAASKLGDILYGAFPKVITGSLWAMLVWMWQSIDPEDAADFIQRLKDGKGLEDGSAILAVRRILGNEMIRKSRPPLEVVALIVKGWNFYREGTPVQKLLIRLGGANPEPYPVAK